MAGERAVEPIVEGSVRRLRRAAFVLLATTVAVPSLLLAVLLVRPVREVLLSPILVAAEGALPGKLHIEDAAWPALSRVTFDDVRWTDGPDTLAAASP